MDMQAFRESVHQVMSQICGYPFGSFEFALLWIIAIIEIFFFGFVFARGLGKSEKNFLFIFIGNFVALALLLTAAGAVKFFFEPKITEPWVVTTLMWTAGVWATFLWVAIFARVLWGNGRILSIIALVFTLAISYGGVWVGQQIIELVRHAEGDIEYYQDKQEEATNAVKDAVSG